MISVKNLCLSFNKEFNILDNISFDIADKERVAFVGESGSGKTCLIRAILGLEKFQFGEVFIKNISLENFRFDEDLAVGYIPKNPVFIKKKSVIDNLKAVLKFRRIDRANLNFKVANALKIFDIESIKDFKVDNLSLYHKQLVQIARVSQRKIELFIVDDILDKLNSNEQDNMIVYLKQLIEYFPNATFIFSFSEQKYAEQLGLKVYHLQNGKINC